MSFLHGVEFLEKTPDRPISVVKSGVIALVGTAPKGAVQTLTLVQTEAQAAAFGKELTGFSIPQAIRAIYDQGVNASILVVNVFDPAIMISANYNEVIQFTNSNKTVAKTTYNPIAPAAVVIKKYDGVAAVGAALIKDTDYTIDDFGNITMLTYGASNVDPALGIDVTYKQADFTAVNASLIKGTNALGVRTGLQLFDLAYNMFGFKAKVLIAPKYSQLSLVADELQAKAVKYKGVALLDTPSATDYADMLTSRGIGGLFFRSNSRTVGCYPWVKVTNLDTGAIEVRPRSERLAGILSNNDANSNKGFWTSPSNTVIEGIVGEELDLTFDIQDANTEVNYLNSIGIVTGANAYGVGILNWGNRNLAYPSNTSVESFINVRRTFDIVEESIGLSMLQFIDVSNVTQGSIDRVKDSVNDFIDILIGRGALLTGTKLSYNPNLNPPNQLATGQVVFTLSGMSAIPIERMTFEVNFDVSLLNFAA